MLKRKKKTLIIVVISAVILAVAVAGIILFVFNPSRKNNEVKDSLNKTLTCMINTDFSDDFKYIDMYGTIHNDLTVNQIPQLVANNISYSLGNVELNENGDCAIVDAEFKSVDMIELLSEITDTENYRKIVIDKLQNKEFQTKDYHIQLKMIKIDDIWYLYETVDFDDVMTGGLYSLDIAAQEQFFEQINKEES